MTLRAQSLHVRRRVLILAAVCAFAAGAAPGFAQGPTATIGVRFAPRDAAVSAPISLRLESSADASLSWTADLHPGETVHFRLLSPGSYRLVCGTAERVLTAGSGEDVVVEIVGQGPRPAADGTDLRIVDAGRSGYGTRFDGEALQQLPGSGGVFGLIERSDPLVVTERIEGGGAYPEMQRLAASGASWTQTSYRLGDADVTDPAVTGLPMFYPNLDTLEAVSVVTAGLPPDTFGAGTAVTLVPRRPSPAWQRTIQFDSSPEAFQSVNELPGAASLARLQSSAGGSFVVSGPISSRVGILVAGSLVRSTRLERTRVLPLPSRTQSLTTHLTYKAGAKDDFRLFAQADRLAFPVAGRARLVDPGLQQADRYVLLSGTWNRGRTAGLAWSANLTYTHASSEPALAGLEVNGTMERLRDGPPYVLASAAATRRHRTYLGWAGDRGAVRWLGVQHRPRFGVNFSWTGVSRDPAGATTVGELIDGTPSRVWQYTNDGGTSTWGSTELAFWAADQIPLGSRVDIDLGLRASMTSPSRSGSGVGTAWRALSPSINTRWQLLPHGRLTLLAGFSRYDARLPLTYLAFGDPHGLTGSVSAWNDRNRDRLVQTGEIGARIAAIGPCCAGGRPNTIADGLGVPPAREFLTGLETRISDKMVLRFGAMDRRQYRLVQPINAAAALTNYSLTHVDDPALDMGQTEDDQQLPIFSRLPASFGTDSYVLQNVEHNNARDHGLDLVLERLFDGRWGMLIGATAHKSEGIGGNRGYGPDENDQGVVGEVFSDPNAQTYARGRLFFERGYIIKWSGLWQLPYGLRGGAAARYQDGQHFTRVVLAPGLPQGMDAIPTLPRGRVRFTYTFTLDTRLEKSWTVQGRRTALLVEVYNLLNTNNEVEEDEVTGPAFRMPTAVQPPRSIRVGLRFSF
jgi:hypothetical protein